MGCQESKSDEQKALEKTNRAVEAQLKKAKIDYNREIKLLLLGTGESGKSTVAKQMRILHADGFTQGELAQYKPVIYNNVVTSMKALVQAAQKFGYDVAEANKEAATYFDEVNVVDIEVFNQKIADSVKSLWGDNAIKQAYERRNEYHLMDSAEYCFANIDRMVKPDYCPTVEDVLRVRARTTGIIETTFTVKDVNFRMVDVGGQRSERKKWIHCFEDVTAIIYCVALNEYDMKLFEDEKVNRMQESLELFEEIVNSKWFTKTAVILFLNKLDLFKDKIKKVDLKVLFPDYNGGADVDAAVKFITEQFIALLRNERKKVFPHTTCATDTENVRVVFEAAKEIIISQNLERLGFGAM